MRSDNFVHSCISKLNIGWDTFIGMYNGVNPYTTRLLTRFGMSSTPLNMKLENIIIIIKPIIYILPIHLCIYNFSCQLQVRLGHTSRDISTQIWPLDGVLGISWRSTTHFRGCTRAILLVQISRFILMNNTAAAR